MAEPARPRATIEYFIVAVVCVWMVDAVKFK
jgi:hypothetical protein